MKFVYEYDENVEISKKGLTEIYHNFLGNGYISIIILALVSVVLQVNMFIKEWYFMLIAFLVLDVIMFISFKKQAVVGARKMMSPLVGKQYEISDEDIRQGETKYQYSDITQIVQKEEFVIIKFGNKILPMIITDENREQIIELVDYIKRNKCGK